MNSGNGSDRSRFQFGRSSKRTSLEQRSLNAYIALDSAVRTQLAYLLNHLDQIESSDNRTIQILRRLEERRAEIFLEHSRNG